VDFDVAAGCDLPYYRIPVRPIYKGYLVYAPGHEPPGYFDWLQQQEPVILWDDRGHAPPLANEADWIHAGEITFDAARVTNTNISVEDVRDPIWLEKTGAPVRGDGTLPLSSTSSAPKVWWNSAPFHAGSAIRG
jgi:hypothetical protein